MSRVISDCNTGLHVKSAYTSLEESPNYFTNIFISFLGLAYFNPLQWQLQIKIFWQFRGIIDPFAPKNEIAEM